MTDLERTKSFLDSLGILYSNPDGEIVFGVEGRGEKYDGYPKCEKVIGYSGFCIQFLFREDGSFENVGIYE